MLAFTVFGIGVYILSVLVAFGKSLNNKKGFIYQLAVIIILLSIWLVMFGIKMYLVNSGYSIDKLTVKQAATIELLVGTLYPFIVGPLIAMFFAIFKVTK